MNFMARKKKSDSLKEENGTVYSGLDLRATDMSNTSFIKCDFTNTILQGCDFTGSTFKNCKFDGADLRWAVNFGGNDGAGNI